MVCPLSQSIVTCEAVKAHSVHLLHFHTSRDDGVLCTSQVYSRSYNALYELYLIILIYDHISFELDRSLHIIVQYTMTTI